MTTKDTSTSELIHTEIWFEEPEADNPFVASKCFCAGYDVYGEILNKASWFEYLFLLFKLERPASWQVALLEKIAIAIANPGIRDHSVRAAMNAGVGGSTSAATLMAALAVGAGHLNGAREIYLMMECWQKCGTQLNDWERYLTDPSQHEEVSVWGRPEHASGFDPHGVSCSQVVLNTLTALCQLKKDGYLFWLAENRVSLEELASSPLSMSGVVATAFADLDFNPEQAEMLYLMLRLPGAAAHALEQRKTGWKKYPFFTTALKITNDPM